MASTTRPASFDAAERLEQFLGDPADPHAAFGYVSSAALDDTEAFPTEACAALDSYGLPGSYVPARHGGANTSYEEAVQLLRVVARRDLTVAIAHFKTYFGGASVWVAGTEEQGRELGRAIIEGVPVSWGLTERNHGSDLLSDEMAAVPTADGFSVSGEKWLVNNATRAGLICTLVRTRDGGGPRGYSLLLIDKKQLVDTELTCLPKISTIGIRGADISGFALTAARVPRAALVGAEGAGLEIVLKALQLTRTMCAGLSLGASDHALRLCAEFVAERELYGRSLLQLPLARQALAECYADHLLGEALTFMAARTIHAATAELSLWSAAAKYLVPTHTEAVIIRLRRLLGARSQLIDYQHGRFEKLERDNLIVSMFDGNTLVNLHSLINQFPTLALAHRRGGPIDHEALATCADLRRDLPELDTTALSLMSRHGVDALRALPAAVSALAAAGPHLAAAAAAAERLREATQSVFAEIGAHTPSRFPTADAYELARRFALCLAGAACLQIWLNNHDAVSGTLWHNGDWLTAALSRVLTHFGIQDVGVVDLPVDALVEGLVSQARTGRLMSLFDCQLAEAGK